MLVGPNKWRIYALGSKFMRFHAVFGKFWQNRMLTPPRGLVPPPQGNPGFATDNFAQGPWQVYIVEF